jgi:hypothetical protein
MRGAGQAARAGSRPAAPGPPAGSGACCERRSRWRTPSARRCRARTAAALAQALLDKPPHSVSAAFLCRQAFVERRTAAASVERRTCVVMLGQGAPRTRMCGQHAAERFGLLCSSAVEAPISSALCSGLFPCCTLLDLQALLYVACTCGACYPTCVFPPHAFDTHAISKWRCVKQRSSLRHPPAAQRSRPCYQHHADVQQ